MSILLYGVNDCPSLNAIKQYAEYVTPQQSQSQRYPQVSAGKYFLHFSEKASGLLYSTPYLLCHVPIFCNPSSKVLVGCYSLNIYILHPQTIRGVYGIFAYYQRINYVIAFIRKKIRFVLTKIKYMRDSNC